MRWWILAMLIGCDSGLQTTSADCKEGYERGDDGSCYSTDGDNETNSGGGSGDGTDDDPPTDGDAGDVDEGPPAGGDGGDGGPGDDGPDDDFDDSCEVPADCTEDRCPEGSMGCTCLEGPDICVPTCNTTADCPDGGAEEFECTDEGICDLPIED